MLDECSLGIANFETVNVNVWWFTGQLFILTFFYIELFGRWRHLVRGPSRCCLLLMYVAMFAETVAILTGHFLGEEKDKRAWDTAFVVLGATCP